jgi:DNA-binding transcriptional LysR family regulator
MMHLELGWLRAFVAVAERLSFTAAADAVARTQSAVSLQIRKLEDRVGFPVFERTPRAVSLTPKGEALLPYARQMLALNDDAVRQLQGISLAGALRLGVSEYFAPTQLPWLLADFTARHPDITLTVQTGTSAPLLAQLRDNTLDAVIGGHAGHSGGTRDGEALFREPMGWLASETLTPPARASVPLIVLPEGCRIRAGACAALNQRNRAWHVAYTSGSLLGLLAAVRAGIGVAPLPRHLLAPGLALAGVRLQLPSLPPDEIALFRRTGLDADQSRLIDAVRDDFVARRHGMQAAA